MSEIVSQRVVAGAAGFPNDPSSSHSFGYECQKRSNLVVLDIDVVAFSAGNLVQLLNLSSLQQTRLRTLGGGGIGALAVHPSRQYLAVGEKGSQPVLAIYTYPQLQLHRILRGGAQTVA